MKTTINDFVLDIATINGSGSQSANNILLKTLFRMGIPVGGKNLFPSNIAGLPTWFSIRANDLGFTGRRLGTDIMVAMNPQTFLSDMKTPHAEGIFIYNGDMNFDRSVLRDDLVYLAIPFRQIADQVTTSVKLKKLLTNMIYVGILAELLNIDSEVLNQVMNDQFKDKPQVIDGNLSAIKGGREYARNKILASGFVFPYGVKARPFHSEKILIDGNTSAALGLVYGGCTFVAWYPITPSSSLVESFISLAEKYRKDENGKNTFAVVQAEDELASISMVAGAGWAGARAMTATSGPGLSLMAEAAGLSYFAEVPTVVWDVQRVGPSTGLPTRTMQADLLAAAHLSHGDTEHVVLIPGNPQECFDFGQLCFDLAERLQTFVCVLSDLDLGMNFWITDAFQYPTKPFDRGKVLDENQLAELGKYQRYLDVDNDGIPYRCLPGTRHELSGTVTRGSGHNDSAQYSEKGEDYVRIMDRLKRKYQSAKKFVPPPIIDCSSNASHSPHGAVGLIALGSTDAVMPEARALLAQHNVSSDYLRIRALPFTDHIEEFLRQHDHLFIIEQNRDAQMKSLVSNKMPALSARCHSILHYDGFPITAQEICDQVIQVINEVDTQAVNQAVSPTVNPKGIRLETST